MPRKLASVSDINSKHDLSKEESTQKIPWWVTRDMADEFNQETVLVTTIRACVVYIIYLVAVGISVWGRRYHDMYYVSTALKGIFTESEFEGRNGKSIKFENIRSAEDFWFYVKGPLLDGLYYEEKFDEDIFNAKDPDDQNILYEHRLLGVPRIRQVRVRNNSCTIHNYFRIEFNTCYGEFGEETEEQDPYGKLSGTAWVYSDEEKTHSISYTGIMGTYNGAGYYHDFGNSKKNSLAMLQDLYDHEWITRRTRAIFVDFALYNANSNFFCINKLSFEMPVTGGIHPRARFAITFLDVGFKTDNTFEFVAECVIYIMGVVYTFEELREIWFLKVKYFKQYWSYFDWLNIVLIFANLVTSLIMFPDVEKLIKHINDNPEKYGNMEYVEYMKHTNNSICALLLFFSIIKLFKYMNFNKTMGQLNNTLRQARMEIAWFTLMFLLIFLAFALLGYLLFGHQVEGYRNFLSSCISQLSTILGDFEYEPMEKTQPFLAPVYFLSFIFLNFFVLLNMFLAIVTDSYSDVKTEIAISSRMKELHMPTFLKQRFLSCLKKLGCKVKTSDKQETYVVFNKIRQVLRKIGFTNNEIELFLAKLDPNKMEDKASLLKNIEAQVTATGKNDSGNLLKLDDFLVGSQRLARLESHVKDLLQRSADPLKRMAQLERDFNS